MVLQVGYDEFSYGYRDLEGSKVRSDPDRLHERLDHWLLLFMIRSVSWVKVMKASTELANVIAALHIRG